MNFGNQTNLILGEVITALKFVTKSGMRFKNSNVRNYQRSITENVSNHLKKQSSQLITFIDNKMNNYSFSRLVFS